MTDIKLYNLNACPIYVQMYLLGYRSIDKVEGGFIHFEMLGYRGGKCIYSRMYYYPE